MANGIAAFAKDGGKIAAAGVYVLFNAANEVEYVGRGLNAAKRAASWGKEYKVIADNLTYEEMRGLEQQYYNKYGGKSGKLKNKIRPVSKRNGNFMKYAAAASSFLWGKRGRWWRKRLAN